MTGAILWWAGKSTACLAVGLITWAVLRRASAAVRHTTLATAVLVACAMPALMSLAPAWRVLPSPFAATNANVVALGDVTTPTTTNTLADTTPLPTPPSRLTIAQGIAVVWGIATVLLLARVVRSRRAVAALLRRTRAVTGAPADALTALSREWRLRRPVQLRMHPTAALVAVTGVWRPRIIVPAIATTWTRERWQVVLRHELAHVRRWDLLWQDAAQLLILLQPWNPLAWLSAQRLRRDSEQACDDVVMASGVTAADYAEHLVDIARHSTSQFAGHLATSRIAHPSTLERRVHAMLQPRTHRHSVTRTGWALAGAAAMVISLPIAAATTTVAPVVASAVATFPSTPAGVMVAPPPAGVLVTPPSPAVKTPPARTQPVASPQLDAPAPEVPAQTASIAGKIVDESGGVIPGVTVTLTDATGNVSRAFTNATGRFTFGDLKAGPYEIATTLPGFKSAVARLSVTDGQTVEPMITLQIGALTEDIAVNCSTLSPASMLSKVVATFVSTLHAQAAQAPIRVGGNVRVPKRTRYVAPACPGNVAQATTVIISATVDATGHVANGTLAPSAQAPRDLTEAALDAIRQWEYTPTQLNGRPVAVEITVTVRFGTF